MDMQDIKAFRESLGLNQSEFWSRVLVTQSGGSRYESGRSIPRSVKSLLIFAYGKQTEIDKELKRLRYVPPAKETKAKAK